MTIQSAEKTAWIYLCKAKPLRAGGGLGVAYNYLSAIHGKEPHGENIDSFLLCGCQLTPLPAEVSQDFDEFIDDLNPGMEPGARQFFQQALTIRHLAARYRKVVILAFTPFYFWPVVRVGLGGRVVCIHSEHSKGGRHHELAEERGHFGLKEQVVRAAVWMNFLFADRAVFPSAGSVSLFQEMNPRLAKRAGRMSCVVHNGVELVGLPETMHPRATPHIVSIAHHVREKGLDAVLDTLSSPELAHIPWRFINYGSPSTLTDELTAQAALLGISDHVEFAGLKPQREVRDSLITAAVFLHLPVIVVFDLSLLEAMMCGTPVITAPLPGNKEALGDDYPYYAQTPAEAARLLLQVLADPADAANTGAALRARAEERFTRKAMADRYLCLMQQSS